MVVSPTVSDDGPAVGTTFILSVTVSNGGDGTAPAAMMGYYRSSDATITRSDTPAGADEVAELGVSGSGSKSVELTAPSTPGTYYYGACVDAVTDESDTTNNCSPSVEVNVPKSDLQSEGDPDLSVPAVSVAASPGGTYTGDAFTVSATVRNDGDGDSAATTLRYYRSTDSTITKSDTEVGTDEVAGLAASASGSESVELTAPSTSGTYYYGACVDAVTEESDTTNNCSTSRQIEVLDPLRPPDLVVASPSVNDDGPVAGESFTVSATVRNDGDGDSAATTLRYYRSADATVTTSDTEVGTDAVAGLAAVASSAESIELAAPSDAGAYYYGACVDEVAEESDTTNNYGACVDEVAEESDTTNNCSTSVKVDVEEPPKYPDLEVGTPTVDEASPETGATFTLSATVSNAGDEQSAASTLRYYRSADSTISSSDTQVGTDAVGALAASGTSAGSISLTAPSTAGTYYYGACVDAVTDESDTTNNCSSSVTIAVEEESSGQPDLRIVGVVAFTPLDGVGPGTRIQFSATVRNYGDANSDATTLRYYRSTDATISVSDTEVGTDEVSALVPSSQVSEGIDLTAPLTAGTYYYGACVAAVADESDTTNNCSSAVTVTVAEPQTSPDLSVGSPTVSDSGPETGGAFTLSATVTNTGDGASVSTTLRYYRSEDATISSSDTQVGTDAVGALAAGGTSDESVALTAPSTAGTYYYGACVDAVTGESSTTNNCSSSVTVTVAEPEPQPDLIVDSFTITLGPTLETSPGALVFLNQRVANVGDAASAATTVRYYRSTDATITTADTQVSTDAVPELTASSRFVEAENENLPTIPGTYYYGACVDAVAGESSTANNCSRSVKVTVPEPQPDLVVGSASVDDSNLNTGDSFTLSATVSNAGDEQSAASTLRYYRSADSTISSSDTQVGTDAVGALAASGTSAGSISLTAPSTAGTYYYGACVDAVTDESDTTNNCSSSVTIAVEEESSGQPDLRIVGVAAFTPLDGVGPGTRIQFSATVRNYGDANSDATTLRYYRSTDATISVSDTEVGTDEVSALVPSSQVSEGIDLTAPLTAGTYYYGACVDAVADESDTTNNCSGSLDFTVAGS